MYKEIIDPPALDWDFFDDLTKDMSWLDDLYEEKGNEEDSLFEYECKVYNETDRRYA